MNCFQRNGKNCYIEFFKLVEKSKLIKKAGFHVDLTRGREILDMPAIFDLKDNNMILDLDSTGELITTHTRDNRVISVIPRNQSVRMIFNNGGFHWVLRSDMMKTHNVITFYSREAVLRIDNTWKDKKDLDFIDSNVVIGNSKVTFLPDRCDGAGVQGISIKLFSNRAEIDSDIVIGAENINFTYSLEQGNYNSKNMTQLVEKVSRLFLSSNKTLLGGFSLVLPTIKSDYDEMFRCIKLKSGNVKQYKKG